MRNLLERALWTGVESGLALLTVEALTDDVVTALFTLQVAAAATVLTALKVVAAGRLKALKQSA